MKYFLILFVLISGCATAQPKVRYKPEIIRFCADYYLYESQHQIDVAHHNIANGQKIGGVKGFYVHNSNINAIHVVKWRFDNLGHEVMHGLRRRGIPKLIVEDTLFDRYRHFK